MPKMNTIVVSGWDHASETIALLQVEDRIGNSEIDDAVALTIASWYTGHDMHGRVFAQLASTRSVDVTQLHDACHMEYSGASARGKDALDMLCTWASNHPSRDV